MLTNTDEKMLLATQLVHRESGIFSPSLNVYVWQIWTLCFSANLVLVRWCACGIRFVSTGICVWCILCCSIKFYNMCFIWFESFWFDLKTIYTLIQFRVAKFGIMCFSLFVFGWVYSDMIKFSLTSWGMKTSLESSREPVLGLRLCCLGDLNNTVCLSFH